MTCSHQWIDPRERWITKGVYSPIIGPHRRQMKWETRYQCNNCSAVLTTPKAPSEPKED